jgi:hypothetical protein
MTTIGGGVGDVGSGERRGTTVTGGIRLSLYVDALAEEHATDDGSQVKKQIGIEFSLNLWYHRHINKDII